jgi:hypothetical protein
VDAVYTSDEAKRRFEIIARHVSVRFRSLLMEPSAFAYAERHDNIETIFKKLQDKRDTADVTELPDDYFTACSQVRFRRFTSWRYGTCGLNLMSPLVLFQFQTGNLSFPPRFIRGGFPQIPLPEFGLPMKVTVKFELPMDRSPVSVCSFTWPPL